MQVKEKEEEGADDGGKDPNRGEGKEISRLKENATGFLGERKVERARRFI